MADTCRIGIPWRETNPVLTRALIVLVAVPYVLVTLWLAESGGSMFSQACDETYATAACEYTLWVPDFQEVYPAVVVAVLLVMAAFKRSLRLANGALLVGILLAVMLPLGITEVIY